MDEIISPVVTLRNTLPSLADLDDLDSSPFVDDDSSDSDGTDYSEALSLTSHSGNQTNQGSHDNEEWVVKVEDKTITISRLTAPATAGSSVANVMEDDYDRDSFASSSSSTSSSSSAHLSGSQASSSATNSSNHTTTTDPGAVVQLLRNTSTTSITTLTQRELELEQELPMLERMDSLSNNKERSQRTFSEESHTDWIQDSVHQLHHKRLAAFNTNKQTSSCLNTVMDKSSSSSSSSSMDPAPFISRLHQQSAVAQQSSDSLVDQADSHEHDKEGGNSHSDEESLLAQDTSSSTVSDMVLLDMDEFDEYPHSNGEEEVDYIDASESTLGEIAEEDEKEEKEGCYPCQRAEPKQIVVLCTKLPQDEQVAARQRLTMNMLETNRLPFEVIYGDEPKNAKMSELLFDLAGTENEYPQLFISTPEGEVSYWGSWEDLMDNSDSEQHDSDHSQSTFSLETTHEEEQVMCEFIWERVPPSEFSSSSQTRYDHVEKAQQGSNIPEKNENVDCLSIEEMNKSQMETVALNLDQRIQPARDIGLADCAKEVPKETITKLCANIDVTNESFIEHSTTETSKSLSSTTTEANQSREDDGEEGNSSLKLDSQHQIETNRHEGASSVQRQTIKQSTSQQIETEEFQNDAPTPPESRKTNADLQSPSRLCHVNVHTNEQPFQASYSERIEKTNFSKISSSAQLDTSDAIMEKIRPTNSKPNDAVMERMQTSKPLGSNTGKVKTTGKAKKKPTGARETATESKVEVENPALNCYQWYNRMGRPSRRGMKQRVKTLPKSCGVKPEHVDLLPWNTAGSTLQTSALRDILLGNKRPGHNHTVGS